MGEGVEGADDGGAFVGIGVETGELGLGATTVAGRPNVTSATRPTTATAPRMNATAGWTWPLDGV
jgi:hypothetical protein